MISGNHRLGPRLAGSRIGGGGGLSWLDVVLINIEYGYYPDGGLRVCFWNKGHWRMGRTAKLRQLSISWEIKEGWVKAFEGGMLAWVHASQFFTLRMRA